MRITLIKVKYVRIAVKKMTDTVYLNNSTKVLNWCTKCLGTVEDITTVDRTSAGIGKQFLDSKSRNESSDRLL